MMGKGTPVVQMRKPIPRLGEVAWVLASDTDHGLRGQRWEQHLRAVYQLEVSSVSLQLFPLILQVQALQWICRLYHHCECGRREGWGGWM